MNLTKQEKTFLIRLINNQISINESNLLIIRRETIRTYYEKELKQLKNLKEKLKDD